MVERKNDNRNITWQPLLLATALVVGLIVGALFNQDASDLLPIDRQQDRRNHRSKVSEVLQYIEHHYFDTINIDRLEDEAIESIMNQLDPHSQYIHRRNLEAVNEKTKGDFEGIGIEFMQLRDTICVIRPITDGPAERANIQQGDKIISINDISLVGGVGIDSIRRVIKRSPGRNISLVVKKFDTGEMKSISLQKEVLPYHSVPFVTSINENTAYIKLKQFNGNSYKEFMSALELYVDKEDHLDQLIIDLRNNPGGYLHEVVKILSQLFEKKDQLLVYTNGKSKQPKEYTSTGYSFFSIDEVIVFVNEHSASASEILAGAIQDWEKGIIVGRRTFGKGLVQEQFPLSKGGAIRLTTHRYHTPVGRLIQRNYNNASYDKYEEARYANGEFFEKDSIKILDSISFRTMKGSPLYTGEGIIPDIFIPKDSISFHPFVQSVRKILPSLVFEHVLTDRKSGQLMVKEELPMWWDTVTIPKEKWQEMQKYWEESRQDNLYLTWEEKDEKALRRHLTGIYRMYYVNYAFDYETAMQLNLAEDNYIQALRSHKIVSALSLNHFTHE